MLDSRASSSHDALRGGPPLPCILVRQAAVALIVIRDRFLESRWLSNSYRVQWFIFNRIHAPYLTWNSYRKLRWNRSVADYTLTSVFSGRARFYIWMIKWMVYLGGSFSRNSGGPFAHCRCSAAEEHVDCIGGYESRWSSLVGRSDPRLFVREIVKRSCDLCKRMQVAAAHDGPAVTESENCCPGGGSRLASFFPLALWCLCPSVSFWTGPCFLPSFSLSLFLFPLSLTPFPPFRWLYSRPGPHRASSFRKLRGIQEKVKRKGPRDVYEWAVLRLCAVQLTTESARKTRATSSPCSLSLQSRRK